MNYIAILRALLTVASITVFYFLFFYLLFEIKFDWTKNRELLLWYNEYKADGSYERKFIKLFKY